MNRSELLQHIRQSAPVVAPSMLKCDFGNLAREVELLTRAETSLLHLDVMDGHFVPNLSYGPMVVKRLRELTNIPFDAHLMISEPARYLDDYLDAGCEAITVHIEAVPEPTELLTRIRSADVAAGLAINPGTPVESVLPFLDLCDLVLAMSVEPGFGGQSFMPVALPKLQALRKAAPDLLLSIDGGIGETTIAEASAAGADILVAGSAVFDQPNYGVAMTDLANRARPDTASEGVN